MKKIESKQMEVVHAGGWGNVACHVGLRAGGALLGGGVGFIVGSIAANVICNPTPAY